MHSPSTRCFTGVFAVVCFSACSGEDGQRSAILETANRAFTERHGGPASAAVVHAAQDGPHVVQYEQEIAGIEVLGARVNVLVDRDLTARESTGSFAPHAPAALPAFVLDRAAGMRAAAGAVDREAAAHAPVELPGQLASESSGTSRYTRFELAASASFIPSRPARIKPVWYPTDKGLLPAYAAEILGTRPGQERPIGVAVLLSAEDGRVLHTRSLIHDHEPFRYRVFAGRDGQPYVDPYGYTNPHPTGLPDGHVPSVPAPMNLLTLRNAGISTDDPWLPDDATGTAGNNVDAFFNADTIEEDFCVDGWGPGFNAAEGDFRAALTGDRTFDHAYDVTLAPQDFEQCLDLTVPIPGDSEQLHAKIVQSFYAANWLHDFFYDLGYDEVAGNAQADNYGRGGIEGDPLMVHAGYATTFAYGPADGESPSITLGFNYTSTSRRDVSSFDFGVLAHEWTHTMYNRLTHTAMASAQDSALNEGTADFVGFFLTVREQDRHAMAGQPPFYGAYAIGAYMNRDYDYPYDPLPAAGTPGLPDNTYYHGIRRFPMSADPAVNPLTFKHIGLHESLPAGFEPFDWKARSLVNSEIHTAGEIWATALWQCARNILVSAPRRSFDEVRRRFLGYLVTGLKLFPTDTTFTEARDAVLFAIRADSETDYRRCRAGFAARGMGAGAVSPPRYSASFIEVIESYLDADRALSILGVRLDEISGGDGDGVLDPGELGRLTVTVKNTGFVRSPGVTVYVPPRAGSYEFPSGSQTNLVALAPGQEHTVRFNVRILDVEHAQPLAFQIHTWDFWHPTVRAEKDVDFVVNYDLLRDAAAALASDLTFAADWALSYDFAQHACGQYLCVSFDLGALAGVLDWQRAQHHGEPAYRIAHARLSFATSLETTVFTVSDDDPFTLVLRHDHDFDRETAVDDPFAHPGFGAVELSIDSGPWESAEPYLSSGPATFLGASGGWRTDTLDFGPALAGYQVQLRLHAFTGSSFYPDDAFWALSHVEIQGTTAPVFSTVHPD